MSGKNESCCLSALAPELLDKILIHLDSIRTLGNFVTAARFIHQHFTRRPGPLILGVLKNELGPVVADAQFLSRLSYATPGINPAGWIIYFDEIDDMAAVYKDLLHRGGDDIDPGLTALTPQCHTLHHMNFISDAYIAVQGRGFQAQGLDFPPPSRSERLRVLRAFYRRQMISDAWEKYRGDPEWWDLDLAAFSNVAGDNKRRQGVMAPLQPWELQQIDHADQFIALLCLSLCLAADEQGQPLDVASFGKIFAYTSCLVRYVREHPTIADAAFSAVTSSLHSKRSALHDIAPLYSPLTDRFSQFCLQFAWQKNRMDSYVDPTEDQRVEQLQQQGWKEYPITRRIDFIGDAADLVPFGWVDASGGLYVDWFGGILLDVFPRAEADAEADAEALHEQNCALQLWRSTGFAMWDQQRVKAIKKLDHLRALKTGWLIRQ